MEMREIDVVVGAATAFKALTTRLGEVVSTVSQNGNGLPAADLQLLAQRLLRRVHQADLLTSQMLAYAGAQSLAPTKLELLPLLSDLAYSLLRTLDVRIQVFVDVGHDCPPCLADTHGLEDALLNLVANARDAMPEGGRIQLSAKAVVAADGSPAVAVAVSDNGVGMASDFAHRARLPFVTTKTNSPYAGMGLAATDGFARQSGGTLTLVCRPRGGVTATLILPQALPSRGNDASTRGCEAAKADRQSTVAANLVSPSSRPEAPRIF